MFKDISIKRKFQAVSDQTTELLRLKVSLDLMVKDTRAEHKNLQSKLTPLAFQ